VSGSLQLHTWCGVSNFSVMLSWLCTTKVHLHISTVQLYGHVLQHDTYHASTTVKCCTPITPAFIGRLPSAVKEELTGSTMCSKVYCLPLADIYCLVNE
jgi:hypothetical protein